MERRLAGVAMMTLILITILAVPGIVGRSLPGTAAPAVRVNPRPSAGDCLAPLATPDQLNSVVDLVPVVPCTRPHSAEVLAVGSLNSRLWPSRPSVNDPSFTAGPESQRCDQQAGAFVGWGARSALHRIPVVFFTRLTVPGDLEWRLGQRWYSCELLPGLFDFPISYQGTARNASVGTPPGAFANCADEPGAPALSCDRPHHAEQLTRSFVEASASDVACPALAAKVIGTPDPTFSGQLAVLTRTNGATIGCWVVTTSSRSLTATLINHGPGPLPLT